ncbi:SRPBCC family protein [Mucilaginibacter sp. dw_454]|uniref:SRPBCC family protein n=1 Tax=Mucilaginibacter sp. dw_454 TaxID=2720079 RepID=UPI001BD4AAB1|nr:SRPBCC family protein [Mucilaginibacter sp. dw_454]
MNINPKAPVITNDEILINAPLIDIWNIHTDISGWSDWNNEITASKIEAPAAIGKTFSWTISGMEITSTISELIPGQKIAWSGTVNGVLGIHVWLLRDMGDGVLVNTAESLEGDPIVEQVDSYQNDLNKALRTWLENLKKKAEGKL